MWQLDNRTPFPADRAWVRDRDGAEVWLVAVKATFDIRADGSVQIAKEQPPVLRLAEHHGDPATSSIRYDADLVLTKKTTDVLVVGHACAPQGQSVTQVDVGLQIGSIAKTARVFGDRTWRGSSPSDPRAFVKLPLVYERAYGGVDPSGSAMATAREWRNPVGAGFCVSGESASARPLPNIERTDQPIRSWRDRPEPVGFGAIPVHWPTRAAHAGTYGDHWMRTRQPLLAEDMDDRFYQSAPADQQSAEFLRGGEAATLHGMNPAGRISCALPKLYFAFETKFNDGRREVHRNRQLHTVLFEPDHPRVSLVWHSALSCHFDVHKLEYTTITLKADVSHGPAPRRADAEAVVRG
jgi:hypothetical protein